MECNILKTCGWYCKLFSSGPNVHFHLWDLSSNEIIKHKAPSGGWIESSSLDDCTDQIKKTMAKYSLLWKKPQVGRVKH